MCICSYPWGIQRHVCLVQPVCRPRPSFQPWCHRTICRRAAQCLNMCLCVCACIFSPQGFFAMFHVIIQVNKHEQWERRIWVKDSVLNRKHCQWRLLTLPVKSHSKPHVLGFRFTLKGFFLWVTVRDSKCLIIGYITCFTLFYIVYFQLHQEHSVSPSLEKLWIFASALLWFTLLIELCNNWPALYA